ncbi:MAG: radical SAM family heme chaperone HemW [Thermoanaerobaculales bacterium]|jgi:oxygen-independent coproporphyrinogen-3 oxidase|nr:radical SAM family heme chaperone HemW [Thermoanaerobaculales bacterium]
MTQAGLYIHVPFCTSVCPYCDFSVTMTGEERREGYLAALELEIARSVHHDFSFGTVYLGGGTPSSLRDAQLTRIRDAIRSGLHLAPDPVFHIEINPEDVQMRSAGAWRDLGFRFASLGVQSFDDDALAFLGRGHDGAAARRAAEVLVEAGFETVSVDLIFGLPGQPAEQWRRQLETALELGVHHLSCYQLTIHDGTIFGNRKRRGELTELHEDGQAELYLLTHEVLGAAGWEGYEVSNFAASPEHRSIHNRKYWDHTPYIGLGPSAHSFDGRRRWWNRSKLRLWAAELASGRSPAEGSEELTDAELFFEAVMLGLRTADGIDLEVLQRRFGPEIAVFNDAGIESLVATDHLHCDGSRLLPTPRGLAVAEALLKSILR